MKLKTLIVLITSLLYSVHGIAQTQIIFRGDDMGFSHAANMACIDAYKNGVVRSVEVIVPGPWFEEAVQLLNENPGLDVGVHLALTSEWRFLKWKPLTYAPSLVDENGNFYQRIRSSTNSPEAALTDHDWNIEEVEKEFRAQIELAIKRIPQVTHFTGHMGCTQMSEEVKQLSTRLAKEYNLNIFPREHGFHRLPRWTGNEFTRKEKFMRLEKVLTELKPGKYFAVTHPAYETEETKYIHHIGYENVGADRDAETKILTDVKVKQLLDKRGIEIIGYKDLK